MELLYYLTYKAKKIGFNSQVILSGRGTNDKMSLFLSKIFINELRKKKLGNNILILGLTFKENVGDIRNSKVFDLINHLKKNKYNIDVFDPLANIEKQIKNFNFLKKIDYKKKYDGIFIAVGHDYFKKCVGYKKIKNLTKS